MTGISQLDLKWKNIFSDIFNRVALSEAKTYWAMSKIISRLATDAQIATFATGLWLKDISAAELQGIITAMQEKTVLLSGLEDSVDIVGTGGDRLNSVNISTMAALVTAAAGKKVVKHGNKSVTSKCGGADILSQLGVNINLSSNQIKASVANLGIGYCFAQVFNPAFKYVSRVRKEIGVPTIFNLLGPLLNPATPNYGLIGCAFKNKANVMAQVLQNRRGRFLVVRGEDGLDEISVVSPTQVWIVQNNSVNKITIEPQQFGFPVACMNALVGAGPEVNAQIFNEMLAGKNSSVMDAVLFNSGAAIAISDNEIWENNNFIDAVSLGIKKARTVIMDGTAQQLLADWIKFSN